MVKIVFNLSMNMDISKKSNFGLILLDRSLIIPILAMDQALYIQAYHKLQLSMLSVHPLQDLCLQSIRNSKFPGLHYFSAIVLKFLSKSLCATVSDALDIFILIKYLLEHLFDDKVKSLILVLIPICRSVCVKLF